MTASEGRNDAPRLTRTALLGIPRMRKPPRDPSLFALVFLLLLPAVLLILATRLVFIGVLLVLRFLRAIAHNAYAKAPPVASLLLVIPGFALFAVFTAAMVPFVVLLRCNLALSGYDHVGREHYARAVIGPALGEPDQMRGAEQALDRLVGLDIERAPAPVAAPPREAGSLVTILFTDVAGSTSLTQRLGDAKAREVLRAHERIVREALKAHSGSEIKHTGDGIMASFSSGRRALQSAIAMQRAFAQHNETAEEPINVRIGLNAGEPIAEEEDLFGTAVILAARIAAEAEGGQILTANVVRDLAAGKGFLLADRGDLVLRGFADPVRLFEVRW